MSIPFRRLLTHAALAAACALPFSACSAEGPDDVFPKTPDPFSGNYVGRWTAGEDVDPDIAAQVIALGKDQYHVVITAKLHMRAPIKEEADVTAVDGHLKFDANGVQGDCDGKTFNGGRSGSDRTFKMDRLYLVSPTMGKAAPEGATQLFDGKNLDQWTGTDNWQILPDGVLLATPKSKYLESKLMTKDCELHVEFRTSFMPTARGQARSNSGVFLQGTFECQVLDTFGLPGYYDECGALYKVSPPRVNACLPPLEWQTYDITYRAPRFDANGKEVEFPRMNVYQNGILIQHDQEMPQITGWKEKDRLGEHPKDAGPVKLQGHGNFVQYRNIWVKPIN